MRIYQCLLTLLLFHACLIAQSPADILKEANANYQQGEQARTLLEREKAFNQALGLYLELSDQIAYPSSQLNQAIANSYDQLGEYAWSILYNERALQLEPRNVQIINQIVLAKEKLGFERNEESFSLWQKLLLNSILSLGQRIELFFWLFLLTICLLSLMIWHPNFQYKNCCQIALTIISALSFLLLFNLLINFYFGPIEGILINSTGYYREPDIKQPQLTALPLRAGTKIRILAAYSQGSWLKVKDSKGLIGYIPATSIRII